MGVGALLLLPVPNQLMPEVLEWRIYAISSAMVVDRSDRESLSRFELRYCMGIDEMMDDL